MQAHLLATELIFKTVNLKQNPDFIPRRNPHVCFDVGIFFICRHFKPFYKASLPPEIEATQLCHISSNCGVQNHCMRQDFALIDEDCRIK